MEFVDKNEIEQSCCFTGHRVIQLADADIKARLYCEVETLVNSKGVTTFWAGGALGFDTVAALCVISLKGKYPFLKLRLALPCKTQFAKWSEMDRQVYNSILEKADSVCYISDEYTSGCMHKRNNYMVAHSRYCICYLRHGTGGTFYTVGRAKQQGRELIML